MLRRRDFYPDKNLCMILDRYQGGNHWLVETNYHKRGILIHL